MGDYSISKYQPELYDDTGCYRRNEWSSVGDIGKTFYNGVLSIDEYMKVEQRYIEAAMTLARLSGCTYLTISNLEGQEDIMDFVNVKPYNIELSVIAQKIKQGLRVRISDCADYLRLCIREYCWAIFANHSHNFSIDFGYDLYMHVHTDLPESQVEEIASAFNLYLRP